MTADPRLRYHTIFFDVGGTLLTANPSVGAIYSEVAARFGINVPAKEVEERARKRLADWRADGNDCSSPHTTSLETTKRWWRGIVRESLGAAAESPRFEAFFQEVFDEFHRPERYQLFPEVPRVLDALERAGHRIGIISNWDSRLRRVLEGHGLAHRCGPIVISCEAGFEKPDARIYEYARRASGAIDGERLIQIGDSRIDDFDGAIAAGFDARLVKRNEGETLEDALADLL